MLLIWNVSFPEPPANVSICVPAIMVSLPLPLIMLFETEETPVSVIAEEAPDAFILTLAILVYVFPLFISRLLVTPVTATVSVAPA